MRIDTEGRVASFVREGDYFTVVSGTGGTSFEYSPDAPEGARVLGAFAASKTLMRYLDVVEASNLFAEFGTAAEGALLDWLRTEESVPEPPGRRVRRTTLKRRMIDALYRYAATQTGASGWRAGTRMFYEKVFSGIEGMPNFGRQVREAMRDVAMMKIGLTIEGEGHNLTFIADWKQLAGGGFLK